MQKTIALSTDRQNGLYDIIAEVVSIIKLTKVKTGIRYLTLKFLSHFS